MIWLTSVIPVNLIRKRNRFAFAPKGSTDKVMAPLDYCYQLCVYMLPEPLCIDILMSTYKKYTVSFWNKEAWTTGQSWWGKTIGLDGQSWNEPSHSNRPLLGETWLFVLRLQCVYSHRIAFFTWMVLPGCLRKVIMFLPVGSTLLLTCLWSCHVREPTVSLEEYM